MRCIKRSSIAFGIALALAMTSIALSAPVSKGADHYLTVKGRVLKIDAKERTLLVADWKNKDKLYLVNVPEEATLKITFGMYMRLSQASFEDVFRNDRVEMRCIRTSEERLARLDDGGEAYMVTVARR